MISHSPSPYLPLRLTFKPVSVCEFEFLFRKIHIHCAYSGNSFSFTPRSPTNLIFTFIVVYFLNKLRIQASRYASSGIIIFIIFPAIYALEKLFSHVSCGAGRKFRRPNIFMFPLTEITFTDIYRLIPSSENPHCFSCNKDH